jgi:hypothetical protein
VPKSRAPFSMARRILRSLLNSSSKNQLCAILSKALSASVTSSIGFSAMSPDEHPWRSGVTPGGVSRHLSKRSQTPSASTSAAVQPDAREYGSNWQPPSAGSQVSTVQGSPSLQGISVPGTQVPVVAIGAIEQVSNPLQMVVSVHSSSTLQHPATALAWQPPSSELQKSVVQGLPSSQVIETSLTHSPSSQTPVL